MFKENLIPLLCTILILRENFAHPPPDCDSEIYCHGEMLFDIQTTLEFDNSASFVNMKLKFSPDIILTSYKYSLRLTGEHHDVLRLFVDTYFEPYTAEKFLLSDHNNDIFGSILILDEDYRKLASFIKDMWFELAVKTGEDVKANEYLHSLIHLPYGYIKSDQFTSTMEYWETYYAFRGLLVNMLFDTARGIILNFAKLIEKYGFVPQSNRVYFSRRPQTPMLGLMLEDFMAINGDDKQLLLYILPLMEAEFQWWYDNRLISVQVNDETYSLFRFDHESEGPRPEEYKIDFSLASQFKSVNDEDLNPEMSLEILKKQNLYFSAAHSLSESGFGFTSRFNRKYFRTVDDPSFSRLNTDVKNFIPVELNCIMQRYAYLLKKWNTDLNPEVEKKFQEILDILTEAINRVLWNEDKKMWFDWDLIKKDHNISFSPTNLMPLFTSSYDSMLRPKSEYGEYAVNYLIEEDIISSKYEPNYFIIPTSKDVTGEAWDYPFGSPLLNLFVIEGLQSTGQIQAMEIALKLARRMVKTCYEGYTVHNTLFKEYDATRPGSKREPPDQKNSKYSESGYAPTNGAVLVLLKLYGHLLKSTDYDNFIPWLNFVPVE